MERLTMIEEFDSDGTIWKIDNDGGYIVQVNRCGEDDLYHTDDLEEARAYFLPEEEEELPHIVLENGMRVIDLMVKYETLSKPMLDRLMEEQGYYLDKERFVIRKK